MLVSCVECLNQISEKAVICPKCGYPIRLYELIENVFKKEINISKMPVLEQESNLNYEDEKVIYTVQEIKQIMNIGINQTYNLIKSGSFPIRHIGKKIVIPVKPFTEWLNANDQKNEV